jgi:hypothetical protein
MKIFEFFQEANGQLSNIRLNATMLVMAGIFVIVYAVIISKLDASIIGAGTMLITMGIGGKLIQKGQENGTSQ